MSVLSCNLTDFYSGRASPTFQTLSVVPQLSRPCSFGLSQMKAGLNCSERGQALLSTGHNMYIFLLIPHKNNQVIVISNLRNDI